MYLSSKKEKPVLFVGFFFRLNSALIVIFSIYILCIIFMFTFVYIFVALILNLCIMYELLIVKNENVVVHHFNFLSNAIEMFFSLVSSNFSYHLILQHSYGFVILTYNPYNELCLWKKSL